MKKLFNIIAFQACWWICVIFASSKMSYVGPLAMLLYLFCHFLFVSKNVNEYKFIFLVGLVGTFFDSLFIIFNIFHYSSSYTLVTFIVPTWITSMWIGFATTINHSLKWIKNNYFLAFIMGFIFGPLSYLTGEKFGAIQFNVSLSFSLFLLAFCWGIVMILVLVLNKKIVK